MASGLAGLFGNIFGYGVNNTPAAQQLANQGVNQVQLQTGEEEQNAAAQQMALSQYQQMAAGLGPSAAQAQLSAGLQQSIAAQQAAAQGGRYGQNAALRQRQAAQTGAGLAGGAANQAAQLRAQEQQAGIQGSAATASQMRGQALQAATTQGQFQQQYNQLGAGLYGQEQGQQAQAGIGLQNSLFGGAGSLVSQGLSGLGGGTASTGSLLGSANSGLASVGQAPVVLAGAAHGAVAGMAHGGMAGQPTYVGERGPELLLPQNGQAKLIDKPGMVRLGQHGRDIVVPLKKGSAPYKKGSLPKHETKMPSKPAPKQVELLESAKKAMAGKGKVFSPGPGAKGLSPETAPLVAKALADHGIDAKIQNARQILQHSRVLRALQHAGRR